MSGSSWPQALPALLVGAALLPAAQAAARKRRGGLRGRAKAVLRASGAVKERPLLDRLITSGVKTIEAAELARVSASSEAPSAENGGWSGEPREWANKDSLTQRISTLSQGGLFADFKQFIADRLAGDYDREAIGALIDKRISSSRLMMFSFSTCPFCLRAKSILKDKYGADFDVYECDLESEGYAVRAELGRRTGRTSMPSTWLGPDLLLGGCNDGGIGGVATLDDEDKLGALLEERRAIAAPAWWEALFGVPGAREKAERKSKLLELCSAAPKNGVGVEEGLKAEVEEAAKSLEAACAPQPARSRLSGIWDLLYCTAPGSSNGKLGPLVGDVTQTFLDERRFVNAVELYGILKVALQAEREVLDDRRIRVLFKETVFSVFGLEVFRKETKGSGVWEQRYVDDGLRVMNTPSLFVLQKRL